MADRHQVLVIGATGTVGRGVVSKLLDASVTVRGLVRDPDSADLPSRLELARGDLSDPESLTGALDGVSAIFLVWPFTSPEVATELAPAAIDVIAEHSRRIVYLSADAAGTRPESFWARVERLIESSSADWTFLRPTGFAKNTLMWADQIRADGVVRWPYAAASRSLIHEADIAAVAARAPDRGRPCRPDLCAHRSRRNNPERSGARDRRGHQPAAAFRGGLTRHRSAAANRPRR